jgi:acyl-CoA reductase-like NAD-dependent aldehyde dehydrogenase
VIPFSDVDEVVRLSNDTEYGLAAAIWTRDIGVALRTAKAVRAGVVWINDSQPAPSEALWGGYKQSGIGRSSARTRSTPTSRPSRSTSTSPDGV